MARRCLESSFALAEGLCTFLSFLVSLRDCFDKLWMDGRGPLRTAVVRSVGLLDPSYLCLPWWLPVLFCLGSLVCLCRFLPGNVVGRDSVHWACERVLELQCLTVTFCSAHGGLHADTQFFAVVGERVFVSVFAWFLGTPRNVKPVKLKLQFLVLFFEVFVTCNATVCFGFLSK